MTRRTGAMPTYEIVRTDAGWHTRFRAINGRIVWTTEVYTRRRAALNAIRSINAIHYAWVEDGHLVSLASRDSWNKVNHGIAHVVDVDEREAKA